MAHSTTDHIHIFQMCITVKNNPLGISSNSEGIKLRTAPRDSMSICGDPSGSRKGQGKEGKVF